MVAADFSVVIPAYNEAVALPQYLPNVMAAANLLTKTTGLTTQVLVVDNASTDGTAEIAAHLGADVVTETRPGIAFARNAGARAAGGRYLAFFDADVAIPLETLLVIHAHLANGRVIGGAVEPLYTPRKRSARLFCAFWGWYRRRHGTAQGVAQFFSCEAFEALGGYDTTMVMAEDSDLYQRLRRLADASGRNVVRVTDIRVRPSTRRYDEWSIWRMFFWQNPWTARLALHSRTFWRAWRERTVR